MKLSGELGENKNSLGILHQIVIPHKVSKDTVAASTQPSSHPNLTLIVFLELSRRKTVRTARVVKVMDTPRSARLFSVSAILIQELREGVAEVKLSLILI